MKILVIQGPNLNLLGHRDPRIYGPMTLEQIHESLRMMAKEDSNIEFDFFHSNLEGEIIDKLQETIGDGKSEEYSGIIINPAAYSHTSIAIADAISSTNLPTIEVHLSNIFAREDFRAKSITARACTGVISGFGPMGYNMAFMSLVQIINELKAMRDKQGSE